MKKSKIKRSEWLAHAPHRWTFIICRKCLCFEMCTSDQNVCHSNANTSDDNNNHHHHTNDGIHQVEVICRPLKFKMLDKIDSKQWASERERVVPTRERNTENDERKVQGFVEYDWAVYAWLADWRTDWHIRSTSLALHLLRSGTFVCVLISFNQHGYITDYIHFMLHTLAGMCLWLWRRRLRLQWL